MTQPTGDAEPRINRPRTPPAPGKRSVLCPYCGEVSPDMSRCVACGGHFDPLSRQASQNAMGSWFVRDAARPFRPGCSYETLRELVRRGKIGPETVIRGPTTHQFWTFAARAPSIANLLGRCHNCHSAVDPGGYMCASCGAAFTPETDRQHLGLAPVHLLPGQTSPELIAASAAPHVRPVAGVVGAGAALRAGPPASGAPDEMAGLRRQLRFQWAAMAAIFVVMAGLGVWLARAAFRGPAAPAMIGGAAAPTERPEPPATNGAGSREGAPVEPTAATTGAGDPEPAVIPQPPEARDPRARDAFIAKLTELPLDSGSLDRLAEAAAGADGRASELAAAVRRRDEQLGLTWLP